MNHQRSFEASMKKTSNQNSSVLTQRSKISSNHDWKTEVISAKNTLNHDFDPKIMLK